MTLSYLLQVATIILTGYSLVSHAQEAEDLVFPNQTLTRLAFGSCHNKKYVSGNGTIWKSIADFAPEVWVWTGDSIYGPKGIASLDALKREYDNMRQNKSIGYGDFVNKTQSLWGVWGTFDDHDYGGNDMGRKMPQKKERADLFARFVGRSPFNREGVYHSVTIGSGKQKVKIILLDTRTHRDDHCVPSIAHLGWIPLAAGISCVTRWLSAGWFPSLCSRQATILGTEQWNWLENELRFEDEAPAVTLVISSIQVLTTNPTMEGWGHFPSERDRLIKMLAKLEDTHAFVLSGDVHHGEILDPMASKKTFLEVTSSGLTHDCADKLYGRLMCRPLMKMFFRHRFDSRDEYFIGKNFGTVSVDWDTREVEISVRDASGNRVLTTGSRSIGEPPERWASDEFDKVNVCMDGHLMSLFLTSVAFAVAATYTCWPLSRGN